MSRGWPIHLWLPDLAVDHDAPVCETCGCGVDGNHYGDSLYMDRVNDLEGEREALRGKLRQAVEALRGEVHYHQERSPAGGHRDWSNPENAVASAVHQVAADRLRAHLRDLEGSAEA